MLEVAVAKFVRLMPLSERRLKGLARAVWQSEKAGPAQISIAIVGDRRMANLTAEYVGRRYRTDVLAFDLSDKTAISTQRSAIPNQKSTLLGEVVLNAALARERGATLGVDPAAELALYLVHGLLHLLGHDDKTPAQGQQMHRRAISHLRKARFKITPALSDLTA